MRRRIRLNMIELALLMVALGIVYTIFRPASSAIWERRMTAGRNAMQTRQYALAAHSFALAAREAQRDEAESTWLPESLFSQGEAIVAAEDHPHPGTATPLPESANGTVFTLTTPAAAASPVITPRVAVCPYTAAYQQYLQVYLPTYPEVSTCRRRLEEWYLRHQRSGDAERIALDAVRIVDNQAGPTNLLTTQSLFELANLYRRLGKPAAAAPVYRRIAAIYHAHYAPDSEECTSLARIISCFERELATPSAP